MASIEAEKSDIDAADAEDVELLEREVQRLRNQLAAARRTVAELTELADQDPLIEIMNRRAFVRELSRMMASVERYDMVASLVYVDLNGLKWINDNHGHNAGDAVLKYVGETLAAQIRQTDAVGRLGGDEFGILLAHANMEQGTEKMSHLASFLKNQPLVWENCALTASISFGIYPIRTGQCVEETLREADQAMYEQKQALKEAAFAQEEI
ncbi:MAG: GGDEF domain-containing protein [Parvularculaceae bacterium]